MASNAAAAHGLAWADRVLDSIGELEVEIGRADAVIPDGVGFRAWCEELGRAGLRVDGKPFTLAKRYALHFIYDLIPSTIAAAHQKTLVCMKGAQVGLTVWEMLANIYLALRLYPCTVGAYVPDMTLAAYKSTERFMPILRLVPVAYSMLKEEVSHRKKPGEGNVLTRSLGASKILFLWTSGKVTTESYPMDALSLDEVQEMDLADIERVSERMSASAIKFKMLLSTAKLPDYDIDWWFKRGTRHHFHTDCRCAGGIILDADDVFPNCIVYNEGEYDSQGAPRDYVYRCPRCDTYIADSQMPKLVAGRPIGTMGWVAEAPEAGYVSCHYPQTLSSTVTAREMYEAFVSATDLENFYRRKLGRPWVDPSKVPITPEILQRCVEAGAAAGVRWKTTGTGTYMGIDQMGGFNCAMIKERLPDGRQALIHAEAIFGDDPFARCGELMDEFNVVVAVVENLPNWNDAFRFAQDYKGRVFVCDYGAVEGEMIAWRDASLAVGKRKTKADERLRYTVAIDQYKCMQVSMARMAKTHLLFPDPMGLHQQYNEKGKPNRRVALLKEVIFTHFLKTALVTEAVNEDNHERKVRKRVVKIGIDPHFSYANMLCDVAWARAHGTSSFIMPDTKESAVNPKTPKDVLNTSQVPLMQRITDLPAGEVCGKCTAFEARGWCNARGLEVQAKDAGCPMFVEAEESPKK